MTTGTNVYSPEVQKALDTIRVGSFILAYHEGVHKVTGIRKTYEHGDYLVLIKRKQIGDPLEVPQVQYVKVMGKHFDEPKSRRRNECDIRYAELVDAEFITQLKDQYQQRIANLTQLLLGNWEVANSV